MTPEPPVKVGRKGDFQPGYFGPSRRHSLQSYARMAGSSADLAIPRAEAWGSVLRAKGFEPTFADWWHVCSFKTWNAPLDCLNFPPGAEIAQAMFDSVSLAVR